MSLSVHTQFIDDGSVLESLAEYHHSIYNIIIYQGIDLFLSVFEPVVVIKISAGVIYKKPMILGNKSLIKFSHFGSGFIIAKSGKT